MTLLSTKCATCPCGTKSSTEGGNIISCSISQSRKVFPMPYKRHNFFTTSTKKSRLLGQTPRHRIVAGSFKLSHEQVFEVAPDAGLPTYSNHYDPLKGKRSVSGVAPLTDNLFRSGAAGECD